MTRLERVRKLAELEYTNAEIASVLGLRSTRQVQRIKRQAGVPPARPPKLTEEVRSEIRRLSEQEGWPPEEISETLGVSIEAAKRWSIRGPGKEWSAVASALAVRHRRLWSELRSGM